MTPDRHFILDTHPKWQNVVIAAGFSGQYSVFRVQDETFVDTQIYRVVYSFGNSYCCDGALKTFNLS